MKISGILCLCMIVVSPPFFGAALPDKDATLIEISAGPPSSANVSLSLVNLPLDTITHIASFLPPKDFLQTLSSCRLLYHILSDGWMYRQMLPRWGVTLISLAVEEDALVFQASETLRLFWQSSSYLEILRRHKVIGKEVLVSARKAPDLLQRELLLKQAIFLGEEDVFKEWGELIGWREVEDRIKELMEIYSCSLPWAIDRNIVEDFIFKTLDSSGGVGIFFNSSQGARHLKQLCLLRSFHAIFWVAHQIKNGTAGFSKNITLSEEIFAFLAEGGLKSEWRVVKKKKYSRYKRLSLQDVFQQIMSAIDARS
ncbi:MAG: F-box protein [Candidatus Paracaedibacteraceae bacterium]|nr:F-box protein [Candidatus Paracaedibacteraceae bacterium]